MSMFKAYVVYTGQGEDYVKLGVYSTLEAAEKARCAEYIRYSVGAVDCETHRDLEDLIEDDLTELQAAEYRTDLFPTPSTHGWIITVDHLAAEARRDGDTDPHDDTGLTGPRDLTATPEDLQRYGTPFRMFDDDGILYYDGYLLNVDTSAPLQDYGMPGAGCTSIQILVNGQWVQG